LYREASEGYESLCQSSLAASDWFFWRVVLAFPGVFGFFPGVVDNAVGGCPVLGSSMLFLLDNSDEVDSFPVSGE
jgi:hypothetical protein